MQFLQMSCSLTVLLYWLQIRAGHCVRSERVTVRSRFTAERILGNNFTVRSLFPLTTGDHITRERKIWFGSLLPEHTHTHTVTWCALWGTGSGIRTFWERRKLILKDVWVEQTRYLLSLIYSEDRRAVLLSRWWWWAWKASDDFFMSCTSQRNERRTNEVMEGKSVARLARWGGDEWIKRPRISVSVSSQTGSESFIFIIWAASSPRCVWHEFTCAAADGSASFKDLTHSHCVTCSRWQ